MEPSWQLEAVLAHECAHILRCDYLVNLLQSLVETVLFYPRSLVDFGPDQARTRVVLR